MVAEIGSRHYDTYVHESYERQVRISNSFDEDDIRPICEELLKLNAENHEPIVLIIDSNGGDYYPGEKLITVIENLTSPVYGLVSGICYSTAFLNLQSCKRKWALPNAMFLFHNNWKIIHIKTTADTEIRILTGMLEIEIAKRARVRERIISRMHVHLPRYTENEILALMREEKRMGTEEALSRGFIDEIVHI